MIGYMDYRELGKLLGFAISGRSALSVKDGVMKGTAARGDRLLAMDGLMRNRMCSYEEVCDLQTQRPETPDTLKFFSESYKNYKESLGKIDFTDQLERFLEQQEPLDVDYVFGDEAQDFSKLQWSIMKLLSQPAKKLFLAGDDKQAIYEFSGGDPDSLIEKKGTRIVLDTCYRLPSRVLDFAERVAANINKKTPYEIKPVSEGGLVEEIRSIDRLALQEGSWLLLARNRCFLDEYEKALVARGLVFRSIGNETIPATLVPAIETWNRLMNGGIVLAKQVKILYDNYLPTGTRITRGFKKSLQGLDDHELLDYDALKSHYGLLCDLPWDLALNIPEKLKDYIKRAETQQDLHCADNIEVTTIHATKGREADNVVIMPDMAGTTWNEFQKRPDSEHRTFYVGCTRARNNLYLLKPTTENYYQWPELPE
jgi:DNA helicase-2/ATP-dependent DNA helicase PcrA